MRVELIEHGHCPVGIETIKREKWKKRNEKERKRRETVEITSAREKETWKKGGTGAMSRSEGIQIVSTEEWLH